MFNDKTILVTGGTGSFGKSFIKTVLQQYSPTRLIVYSRDELKQYEMQQSASLKPFAEKLRFFIGDVRDLPRLTLAMENVDYVVHAAALKHVPVCEYNPFEAIKTNILGAQNVIDAAFAQKVKKVIALSTDKAASPINLYGATKLCSDKLFVAANNYKGPHDIKFSVVRYGNVMGSRGSVIPLFMSQRSNGIISITDPRMTRFSITLTHAVDLVIEAFGKMWGGEIFVPKIPSYRIKDIAAAIAPECKLEITGIRPGEKLHEEMITETDSLNTIEYSHYFIILPSTPNWEIEDFRLHSSEIAGNFCEHGFSYNSGNNDKVLTVNEIIELIKTHRADFCQQQEG